jgi:hypothetical protein
MSNFFFSLIFFEISNELLLIRSIGARMMILKILKDKVYG